MSPVLASGERFARDFVLLRQIGRGGSGVVWVARQESTGRERALKVFAPLGGSDRSSERLARSRARFVQEARIGGRIRSPHIVEVVAAGVADDGETPWIAMELLQGEDLAARIARAGPLSREECAALFAQLASALGAAHAAGVLHLDLKPENLFLAAPASGQAGFSLKVLDFGIGRMMREMQDAVTVTSAAGSPLWMAPEQSMEQQRVSPATDVWPLGLVAFRALTGRHFWRTGNAPELSFAAWVLEMMTEEIPAASARARALGVDAALPPGFDAWFARCVARDPSVRWRSMDDLWSALLPVLEGRAASPPTPQASGRRRGRRVAAAVGLLLAVGVVAGVAVGTAGRSIGDGGGPPSGVAATVLPPAERVGDLEVQVGAGTAFWHHDGRCVARLSYSLRNVGTATVDLRRPSFSARGLSVLEELSTLPASITLAAGASAQGDLAWTCAGPALPATLTVLLTVPGPVPPMVSTRGLTAAPVETAHGRAPSRAATDLEVRVRGPASAFTRAGARGVRVEVEVLNPTDVPLRVYRAHFALRLNRAVATLDEGEGGWADPQVLPPREPLRGVLSFVFPGDPGTPSGEATLVFAPATPVARAHAVPIR